MRAFYAIFAFAYLMICTIAHAESKLFHFYQEADKLHAVLLTSFPVADGEFGIDNYIIKNKIQSLSFKTHPNIYEETVNLNTTSDPFCRVHSVEGTSLRIPDALTTENGRSNFKKSTEFIGRNAYINDSDSGRYVSITFKLSGYILYRPSSWTENHLIIECSNLPTYKDNIDLDAINSILSPYIRIER